MHLRALRHVQELNRKTSKFPPWLNVCSNTITNNKTCQYNNKNLHVFNKNGYSIIGLKNVKIYYERLYLP